MVEMERFKSSASWRGAFPRSCFILAFVGVLICLTEAEVPWNMEGCGTRSSQVTSLVGRNVLQRGIIPWVASIHEDRGMRSKHVCAGAILNERYFVTAARCIKHPKKIWKYKVYTGVDKRKKNPQKYREPARYYNLENIWIHPNYNSTLTTNDIALLKTVDPIRMNDHVNAICLPHSTEDPEGTAYVAGWGHTNRNGKSKPNVLQSTQVTIMPREKCNDVYEDGGILESEFCTELEDRRSCQEDYGSPMVQQAENGTYFLIGIASVNVGCKQDSNPGIYTRVTSFLDWLGDNMIEYRPRKKLNVDW